MTKKLYYDNPYKFNFQGEIENIIEKDNNYEVILKETYFYPEGGGQPSDIGTIDELEVNYVYEKDDIIYHVMNEKPKNTIVNCIVNEKARIDNMEQHTGEHILSAAFKKLFNCNNDSFHLGKDYVSLDINLNEKDYTEENLRKVENLANKIIGDNLIVKNYIVEDLSLSNIKLRKEVSVNKNVRVVQIGDFDYSGCCGTHLLNSGAVRLIKIIKHEKYKGKVRIYFKCGQRAIDDYFNKQNILNSLCRTLNCNEEQLTENVNIQLENIKEYNKELRTLKEELVSFQVEKFLKENNNKVLCKTFEDKNFQDIDAMSKEICKKGDYIVLFSTKKENKLIFTYSGEENINCGDIFKENIKEFNGKGGGNKNRAQGAFDKYEDMEKFINLLCKSYINR